MARVNKNLSYPENIIDSIKTTYGFLGPFETTGEAILKTIQDERVYLTPRERLVIAMRCEMEHRQLAEWLRELKEMRHWNLELYEEMFGKGEKPIW